MSPSDDANSLQEIAAQFRRTWLEGDHRQPASIELLPERLARAAASLLPASGAGLSLMVKHYRVPVGASSDMAGRAERLQFTLGEGPCLEAARTRNPLAADAASLERRWPLYAEELFARTDYRAIIALPLPFAAELHGALNLMFVDAAAMHEVRLAAASEVAAQIAEALSIGHAVVTAARSGDATDDPEGLAATWLSNPPALERTQLWVASGMLMSALDVGADDAVALMRSRAYARGITIDDVTTEILNGSLPPEQLRP